MSSHIFISPHLDDAVLSCGDYIKHLVNKKEAVKVLTVFTGYPNAEIMTEAAKKFHKLCGLAEDMYKYRCEEDCAAMKYIGCEYKHLNFYECLYRIDKDGRSIYPDFDNIFHFECELEQENSAVIQEGIMQEIIKFDNVYVPSAIGNHADHLLVNLAVNVIMHKLKGKLFYYLDFPYCMFERCIDQVNDCINKYQKRIMSVTEQELEEKIEAIKKYDSQINMLFENQQSMIEVVKKYAYKFQLLEPAICLLEV